MNKEAKLKYFAGGFDVIAQGDYVLCSVSKKKINLYNLRYWNVELQEAYFSPIEVAKKFSND
jgi:hypothetical protein